MTSEPGPGDALVSRNGASPLCHLRGAVELSGRVGVCRRAAGTRGRALAAALSADRRTYRFTIRSGFRFSPPSNQPVTAQTFKETIERTLNPKMKSLVAHELTDIAGARGYMAGRVPHISGIVETVTR